MRRARDEAVAGLNRDAAAVLEAGDSDVKGHQVGVLQLADGPDHPAA
jgi:hypothetical protein